MNLQGTILQAIQDLPGDTAGQKKKYINQIAKAIAVENASEQSIPEALLPLVKAKVAKILKLPELLIRALKSEDISIINCVLKIRNLFTEEQSQLLQFDFFYREILTDTSLQTRTKVIKKVAYNLRSKNPRIAEEFFLGLSKAHGVKSALPLLLACSEDFIYEQVIKLKIIFPTVFLEKLYKTCPNLVIRYLTLGKRDENCKRRRTTHNIQIYDYVEFLPRLIKKHVNKFFEFCETFINYPNNVLNITLSKNQSRRFLRKGLNILKNKPTVYLPILSLELVTKLLNADDFKIVIRGMFPKVLNDLNVDEIQKYLIYYPDTDKASLITSVFKEVYTVDLCECPENILIQLLPLLPTDERIALARLKLKKDTDWHVNDYKRCWKSYLPIEEAIVEIKAQISKTLSLQIRQKLLQQMIFVCKVNDDKTALLEVLKYFATKYKNEQHQLIIETLQDLIEQFEIFKLDETHWNVLDEIIKRAAVTGALMYNSYVSVQILEQAIHYKLDHNLSIDDYMILLIRIHSNNLYYWNRDWNILKNYPLYEKKCLETFISLIGFVFPDDNKIWTDSKTEFLKALIEVIHDFNDRNKKNSEITPINIQDHSWIMTSIESTLKIAKHTEDIKIVLKTYVPLLYVTWFKDEKLDVYDDKILSILKKDYIKILNKWEDYLFDCIQYINHKKTHHFIKTIRWYRDIPTKFAQRSYEMLNKKKNSDVLIILGYLLEGSEFEKIIDPLIPLEPKLDINENDAKQSYDIIHNSLIGSMGCDPPVSFNIIKRLCSTDYLSLLVKYLVCIANKTSTTKVIVFAENLLDQRVSVRKHGIRLICLVVPLNYKCSFLLRCWKANIHRSMRSILLQQIWKMFTEQPNEQTWNLLKFCLQDLTLDDEDVLKPLTNARLVPNEYVFLYIEQVLETFENLKTNNLKLSKRLIEDLFLQITDTFEELLPEEFQQELLKKYFFDAALMLNSNTATLETDFIFHTYLKNYNLESRLTFFTEYLTDFVQTNIDKPHPQNSKLYPANSLIHDLISRYGYRTVCGYANPQITKALKKSFELAIKPFQDPISFLFLIWIENFQGITHYKKFGIAAGQQLESIIKAFDKEFMIIIAQSLDIFLNMIPYDKYDAEDAKFSFIEGIIETTSIYSYAVAAELFFDNTSKNNNSRYHNLFMKLKEFNHPLVSALLYKRVLSQKIKST